MRASRNQFQTFCSLSKYTVDCRLKYDFNPAISRSRDSL